VPEISFVAAYAVVLAPNVAAELNRADLNVSPPESRKLWIPENSSVLKLVVIAVEIAKVVAPKLLFCADHPFLRLSLGVGAISL
jgi:hypothetical protein